VSVELRGRTANAVYLMTTKLFQWNKDVDTVNGRQQGSIHEIRDVSLMIEQPRANLITLPFRALSRKYCAGEFALFMGMHNDVESFSFYSKKWKELAVDGRINSAYGKRIFDRDYVHGQISRFEYALSQLIANPETKNAVVMMRDDSDLQAGLKDRCCTLYFQFFIRDGKLDMRTVMRSSDFWFGLPYDIFWFTSVMQRMLFLYNESAEKRVSLGMYTHTCASLHIYEKEWSLVKTAELPAYYNPEKDYMFPVWNRDTEEELSAWLNWERVYRAPSWDIKAKATLLRDSKFHPFLETMGSFLLNKIKTRYASEKEIMYFQFCYEVRKKSTCLDRKVGAALVDEGGTVVFGYNKVLSCNQKCDDKANRICVVEHAEINALNQAKEAGMLPVRAYVSLYPCLPCMTALEEAGVKEVVVLGFSHKGATGTVTLIDPAFVEGVEE